MTKFTDSIHVLGGKEKTLVKFGKDKQVNFQDVYSGSINTLRKILPHIQTLWNVKNAHGTMQVDS